MIGAGLLGWEATRLRGRLTIDLQDHITAFELVRIVCWTADCCVFDGHTTQQDTDLQGANGGKQSRQKLSL